MQALLIYYCIEEVKSRDGEFVNYDQFMANDRLATQWLIETKRPSLLLSGTKGNGKTTLAKALCAMIKALNRVNGKRETFWQYSAKEIVSICNGKNIGRPSDLNQITKTPLLFIDDLGDETIEVKDYGNSSFPTADLIKERYDRMLCTIITTNENLDTLGVRYGERIKDRLNEAYSKIVFTEQSYRK